LWKCVLNNMRKYKELLVGNEYQSFWDFGAYRGKIFIEYNSSRYKLSMYVDFFHPQNLTWHRIWELMNRDFSLKYTFLTHKVLFGVKFGPGNIIVKIPP
jgi:hypothetical protein